MATKQTLKGQYSDDKHDCFEEVLEVDFKEDAETTYKKILQDFNDTLRPHESPRTFIKAEWVGTKPQVYCDFEKKNFMTQKDSRGYYDRMQCIRCGKKRRRYSLVGHELEKIKCKRGDE